MSAPGANGRTGWRVVTQQETMELNGGQQFVKGVKVGFITGAGVNGSVFVPLTQFTPEAVAQAIDAQAASLDTIGTLEAPPA